MKEARYLTDIIDGVVLGVRNCVQKIYVIPIKTHHMCLQIFIYNNRHQAFSGCHGLVEFRDIIYLYIIS